MATAAAMAIRDQQARERIDAATATLAERHGIEIPTVPFIRDPVLAKAVQLEAFATIFEALVDAGAKSTRGDPVSDLEKIGQDAAKAGAALTVAETKDGTPVVATADTSKADAAKMREIHAAHEAAAFADQPDDTADGRKATTKPKDKG